VPRPLFLSLDGLDGTGKSTQFRRLADALRARGVPVTEAIDPGGTELGAELRKLLLFGRELSMCVRAEALLFMASRAELVDRVIRPALDRGEVVLSDRFLLANVVSQGHAGGLDPAALWQVGAFGTGGLRPDVTILLDMPVPLARLRRQVLRDRIENRPETYHDAVRAGFLAEAAADPARIRVIDATPDVESVAAAVRGVAFAALADAGWGVS
jgi:dTMP kinase